MLWAEPKGVYGSLGKEPVSSLWECRGVGGILGLREAGEGGRPARGSGVRLPCGVLAPSHRAHGLTSHASVYPSVK